MNPLIKNAFENGRLLVLLGAGASSQCVNKRGKCPPMGHELAELLAAQIGVSYADESLSDVYAAAREEMGDRLFDFLEEHYKHCTPSDSIIELLKHPIPRIYSLNVDDSVEKAAVKNGRELNVRRRNDKIREIDQLYQSVELIKLNGDILNPADGFIFSAQEYAFSAAQEPLWYAELARDFSSYTFLFIGCKLKEPLFYHHIEKYKHRSSSTSGKSFLLVPSLSEIERRSLAQFKIEHIIGTLESFIDWLKREYPIPLTTRDILRNKLPHLNLESLHEGVPENRLRNVTKVSRDSLKYADERDGQVRKFYKGFKPDWSDILNGVPAWLTKPDKWMNDHLINARPGTLHLLFGSAGSGKTTSLMQIALKLSEQTPSNVYYVNEYTDDIKELFAYLEDNNNKRYYIIFDRIAHVASWLADLLKSGVVEKGVLISSENMKIWKSKVDEYLGGCIKSSMDISTIDNRDADLILDKVKKFGHWTILEKMSVAERRREVLKKAKNQLLIGLIEATSGEGYLKIIEKDFNTIERTSEKLLLLMAGFATQKRVQAGEANLARALAYLGDDYDVEDMCRRMDGILRYQNGLISTRHRIYIEKLFANHVSSDMLLTALQAYIKAFSVFNFPIVQNISRTEAEIFKHLVNFKVLRKLFRRDKDKILSVYRSFEKTFEHEGLFLMQYGLALRSFGENFDAFEKFRIASQAFPGSPQIAHALAQQKLILVTLIENEVQAFNMLDEAVISLRQLIEAKINVYDRYPIITLSEGHVKALHHWKKFEQAKEVAGRYHSELSKNKYFENNERVQQTITSLMKYYLSGKWPNDNQEPIDWDF